MHSLGQMLIRVDGNKAVTETYFTAFHLRPDAQGRRFDEFIASRSIEGGQFFDVCATEQTRPARYAQAVGQQRLWFTSTTYGGVK